MRAAAGTWRGPSLPFREEMPGLEGVASLCVKDLTAEPPARCRLAPGHDPCGTVASFDCSAARKGTGSFPLVRRMTRHSLRSRRRPDGVSGRRGQGRRSRPGRGRLDGGGEGHASIGARNGQQRAATIVTRRAETGTRARSRGAARAIERDRRSRGRLTKTGLFVSGRMILLNDKCLANIKAQNRLPDCGGAWGE